ncbi:MAG TPA: acyl-CoA dehydrogenase family protein [Caulobacterales bacterium]|nr:acyl-CoA dehydrogenase family protein [Caulobacterales bacterium]
MDFDFSEECRTFQEQVRRCASASGGILAARAVLEGGQLYAADLYADLARLGCLGAAIPEQYGGLGLGYLHLCAASEALGAELAPVPLSSTVYLAAELILIAGSESQKAQWLPRIASGDVIATLADVDEPGAACACAGERVSGAKAPVGDGMAADLAIVSARKPGDADRLYLVNLGEAGVRRVTLRSIDPSRPQARVIFDAAPCEPLGGGVSAASALDRAYDRAAILLAFEQLGGAEAALRAARDYAVERRTFGRPIGSYQAIKHKLADVYMANQLARAHAYYGAWALDAGAPELPRAAAGARVAATDAFSLAAQENLQTHGGIGFTWEGDCQLYYRRARHLSLVIGSQGAWRNKLFDELSSQRRP